MGDQDDRERVVVGVRLGRPLVPTARRPDTCRVHVPIHDRFSRSDSAELWPSLRRQASEGSQLPPQAPSII